MNRGIFDIATPYASSIRGLLGGPSAVPMVDAPFISPEALPRLHTWLDAADRTTVTLNGSTVSEWRDKSRALRTFRQSTAARQPTYTANGRNGRHVLTFDGSRNIFSSESSSAWRFLHEGEPYTLFAVFRSGTTAAPNALMAMLSTYSSNTAAYGMYLWHDTRSGAQNLEYNVAQSNFFANWSRRTNVAGGEWSLVSVAANVNASARPQRVRLSRNLDGLANGTGSGSSPGAGGNPQWALVVGSLSDPAAGAVSFGLSGEFAELIICQGDLQESYRLATQSYLASKWGFL